MAVGKSGLSAVLELKSQTRPSTATSGNKDGNVLSEDLFLQTLTREIRRTERSGRPFVLALIRSNMFARGSGPLIVRDLAATIQSSIRETDWMGWYEQRKTLAIVLTEIGDANKPKLTLLTNKISRAIQEGVSAQELNALRVSVRLFPQYLDPNEHDRWCDDIYRDLLHKHGPGSEGMITKRAIDIAGSLFAMFLFLPIFVTIAIVVKLTSPGPVLYCQKRVGQYGRLFDFYKFRSMYVNNDPALHREYVTQLIEGATHVQRSNGMYKLENDPRVTRIGRFLRKSSLDELPQFFNVLRGDMSLVGTRPPLPYEFERYRMWHRRRILEIKPGITGLWQVKGRSRTTFDQMVRMDLRYAKTRTLWLDIKLILQTPVAMFHGIGAS